MIEINGYKIEPTIFPDKTSQVWKLPESYKTSFKHGVDILWEFENEAEIFHLCQLVDLVKELGYKGFLCLHIPYLPYGRQDKEISNETTFALKTFAKIINSLEFDHITTFDAHNYETTKLLLKNIHITSAALMIHSLSYLTDYVIAYPDKGAFEKYSKQINEKDFYGSVRGEKVRNQQTGHIEKYTISGNVKDKNVLIVDDICDGGMTFKLLSEELLKNGAKSVTLYVTHGIFSKGIETLKESGISRIFTRKGEVK